LGDLLVGDFEGYVHILDGVTGNVINRIKTGGDHLFHAPLVVGDIFYTYNHDGELTAMQFTK
jgi:outer membrane protein assembly factor BamB